MIKRIRKKIGRNNPCTCGSGKKYKKCCLSTPPRQASAPLNEEEARFDKLITDSRVERINSMLEVVRGVYSRSRQNQAWEPSESFDNIAKLDALRIEITLGEIEARASEVLASCPHSRQYWFQLLRRLAPLLWEDLQSISKADGSPDWIAEVTKGAGHLVLTCSSNGEPWEWVEEGGIRGINYRGLSRSELLVAAQVFSLSQLRYEAQVRFRFACKGFRVFAEGGEKDALTTQDTESIKRYEARRAEHDTFAGSAGLWCDPAEITAVRKDLCHWLGLRAVVPNHFVLHSRNPPAEISLQYLLAPFFDITASSRRQALIAGESEAAPSFIPYDRLIEHPDLRSAFESAFGLKSEQIVAFIYSVFRLIYTFLRFPRLDYGDGKALELVWTDEPEPLREKVLHHWRDAGVMGFLRSGRADWIERLLIESAYVHASDDSVPVLNEKLVEELFDRFTWKAGVPLDGNTPLLFTEVSSHTLILDGFSAGDFLRRLLLAVSLVSKDESGSMHGRDLTGAWLERQATGYFTRELSLPTSRVIQGRVVKKKREIDIAFVFNRTLFVIDCKAMPKDAAFMEGQHQRIRNRHSEMRKEINEKNPQRIDLITQGLVRDIIAPESFDSAYGLVCTSAVEYLPLEDKAFWLKGVPLVGPPEELLDSIQVLAKHEP